MFNLIHPIHQNSAVEALEVLIPLSHFLAVSINRETLDGSDINCEGAYYLASAISNALQDLSAVVEADIERARNEAGACRGATGTVPNLTEPVICSAAGASAERAAG